MDLDRTLFRTDEFVRDVWQLAGRLYGFDGERERLNALRNAALLHLLFSTGARISELLALDVDDVRGVKYGCLLLVALKR